MCAATSSDVTIHDLASGPTTSMADAIRRGLTAEERWLPPAYLYDGRGSELFVEITAQPEYYPTTAEAEILARVADAWITEVRPAELVEIGSGASHKTRIILDAMTRAAGRARYVGFDVSEDAIHAAAAELSADYPSLEVVGAVGDFATDLAAIPRSGPSLVAFLGSTLGNLHPDGEQQAMVPDLATLVGPDDALVLGIDLVKGADVLEAAYDDAAGVSAAFARNVLAVVNARLGGDFPVEEFGYRARWDPVHEWVRMALVTPRDLTVRIADIDLDVHLRAGEEIRTELSCKFTRAGVERLMTGAGLRVAEWATDADERFALVLARQAPGLVDQS